MCSLSHNKCPQLQQKHHLCFTDNNALKIKRQKELIKINAVALKVQQESQAVVICHPKTKSKKQQKTQNTIGSVV